MNKKDKKRPSYATNLGKGFFTGITYIFQCRKCGIVIQSDRQPTGTCPNGGVHSWTRTSY